MDNAYLNNPEDKYETPWFLLEGGIFDSIRYGTFESFNESLWQLLVALTSNYNKDDAEKQKLSGTLGKVVQMVKGCHYFLHHKKRLNFKEDWIDVNWLPNPYRCQKKYRSSNDQKLNHHLAHFKEPFSKLTREEAQNFVLTFKHFFIDMDLTSWLNLLEDWKSCLNRNDTLFESGEYAPLKTYEKLVGLHEACMLGYHWAEYSYPPPNRHLIEDFLGTTYEGYRYASPFEMIDGIFCGVSYVDLHENISALYMGCSRKRKELTMDVVDLRFYLCWLIETGWLLLQTDYLPEDWLLPDSFDVLHCPLPEKEVQYWRPKCLSIKERNKLTKTLSKLYHDIDVHDVIYEAENRIIRYLDPNNTDCLSEENLKSRVRLLKTLDILTLIVLDFCKRRTKPDGITYPKVSEEEKVEDIDEVENSIL